MTILSQTSSQYKFMALIVIMISASSLAVGCWIVTPTPNPTSTPTLTPTPTPGSFSYQVRVEAKETGKDVRNAEVRIEVAGKADLCGVTDSKGIARIFISSSHAGQPGFLIVEATGYERHKQHIDLMVGALPYVVQLEKSVVSINLTPVTPAAATATPPASVSPSPVVTTIASPVPSTRTITPSPTYLSTSTPTFEAMVVAVNGLNLRSGPGVIYKPPIGYLRKGDILDVKGRIVSNEWIQVVPVNSGTLGWVSAFREYIQINVDLADVPIVEPPSLPTPTPLPVTPTIVIKVPPTLLGPPDGASAYRNRMDLSWDWPGTLGPDDYFQVEIRNRRDVFFQFDESVPVIDRAWVKEKSYHYDIINEAYDREYKWRIIVVKGNPPGEKQWSTLEHRVWEPSSEFELISQPSEMRTLYVEPGEEPVYNGGGGGNGKCYDEYGREIPC